VLVSLVTNRFKRIIHKNTLDELKVLNQSSTVDEYWHLFEKSHSRMLLEGRWFSEKDFIDVFISGFIG
jgi:hypothetical protein